MLNKHFRFLVIALLLAIGGCNESPPNRVKTASINEKREFKATPPQNQIVPESSADDIDPPLKPERSARFSKQIEVQLVDKYTADFTVRNAKEVLSESIESAEWSTGTLVHEFEFTHRAIKYEFTITNAGTSKLQSNGKFLAFIDESELDKCWMGGQERIVHFQEPNSPEETEVADSNKHLEGNWKMVAYTFLDSSEAKFETEEEQMYPLRAKAVQDWLNVVGNEGLSELEDKTGIELTIRSEGTMLAKRVGQSEGITWFDEEGVCDGFPEQMEGVLEPHSTPNTSYVYWRQNTDDVDSDHPFIRYNDGDTIVSELIRKDNSTLYHITSVVTDGSQLDRVIIRYEWDGPLVVAQ